MGSPLAVFLALRGIRPGNSGSQDHILPRTICNRLLNIFHPTDPVVSCNVIPVASFYLFLFLSVGCVITSSSKCVSWHTCVPALHWLFMIAVQYLGFCSSWEAFAANGCLQCRALCFSFLINKGQIWVCSTCFFAKTWNNPSVKFQLGFSLLASIKCHGSKSTTAIVKRLHKQFTEYCRKTKTLSFSLRE